MKSDMHVQIAGVTLRNPVIAASGTFGFGVEYASYVDMCELGGVCFKALTGEPRNGNPTPRIAETPAGVLNSVGLQNPGIDKFVAEIYPSARKLDTCRIANVAGSTEEEYIKVAAQLDPLEVDMLELNVSCPNVQRGGYSFGRSPEALRSLVRNVKSVTTKPLVVKLTPNTDDIVKQAESAANGGADALSLINTLLGLAVDAKHRRPLLANVTGGLSGPAVKPVALRMVYEVQHADLGLPIIGMGGISSGLDAAEFMICGADAVMVGTASLRSPDGAVIVARQLREFAEEEGLKSVTELVGTLKMGG